MYLLQNAVHLLGLLLALLLLVVIPTFIGYCALQPLNERVRQLHAPTQFLLTDFVWLLIQFQLVLGGLVAYVPRDDGVFWIILVFLALAVTAMWCAAVSVLSRAGVSNSYRRGMFILLLLPLLVLLMMAATVFLVAMGVSLWQSLYDANLLDFLGRSLALLLGIATSILLTWLLRKLTQWVLLNSIPGIS